MYEVEHGAECGIIDEFVSWAETARGNIAALVDWFQVLTRGEAQVSVGRILPILSNRAIDALGLPRDGFVALVAEGETTIRIGKAWKATTYSATPSYGSVLASEKTAMRAALKIGNNQQLGGTFERWAADKNIIPPEEGKIRRWYGTAEQHTRRAVVWSTLLIGNPQVRRPIWKWTEKAFEAAYDQKELVARRLTVIKRFQVANEDGEPVATFFNLPDGIEATTDGMPVSSQLLVERLAFPQEQAAKLGQRNAEWYAKRSSARTAMETEGDRSKLQGLDKWATELFASAEAEGIQPPAEKYKVEWAEEAPK